MNPHISFNGDCSEAFHFYEKCLGGKVTMMMHYGETPMAEHVPAEWRDKVIHATLRRENETLSGDDAPPGRYEKPQGFAVALDLAEPADAERIFEALSDRGTVQMALQETFWARRFGMLTDRFAIPWMINCGKPM